MKSLISRGVESLSDVGLNSLGHELNHRNHDCVAELAVGLRVRHLDAPTAVTAVEAHETGTLEGSEASWPFSGLLDQHLRPILVITSRQSARDIARSEQAVAEPVALRLVLRLVILQVLPEPRRQGVFRINHVMRFQDISEFRA